jgi:F-type H+-transporting ATPase subunit beta
MPLMVCHRFSKFGGRAIHAKPPLFEDLGTANPEILYTGIKVVMTHS